MNTKDWKVEFDELLLGECGLLLEQGGEYYKEIETFISSLIEQVRAEVTDEVYRELHFRVGAIPHDTQVVHPEWRDEVLYILDVKNIRNK